MKLINLTLFSHLLKLLSALLQLPQHCISVANHITLTHTLSMKKQVKVLLAMSILVVTQSLVSLPVLLNSMLNLLAKTNLFLKLQNQLPLDWLKKVKQKKWRSPLKKHGNKLVIIRAHGLLVNHQLNTIHMVSSKNSNHSVMNMKELN